MRRDPGYFCDDRRATLGPVTVGEAEVVESANLSARHFRPVNEDDHRGPGLHAARIQARVDAVALEEVEAILAIARKDVRKVHAAPGPERVAVLMLHLTGGTRARLPAATTTAAVEDALHFRHRFADRNLRDLACCREVLLHEGRGDDQRTGNIAEAVDFDFGGQDLLRIDLDADQVSDGGR